MKSTVLWSAVIAILIFGGCSSKEPVIDATDNGEKTSKSSDKPPVATEVAQEDTVVVDEEGITSMQDTTEMAMRSLERRMQAVNFAFDKFDIAEQETGKIQDNAVLAKGEAADFTLKVEGNCDEWGSDEYNFALGLKRAKSVKAALVDEGVNAERITMVSYGESNPVCLEKTKECWAKNRRVDFKLLP